MKVHRSPYRYHPAKVKRAAHTSLIAKDNSHFFKLKKLELFYEKNRETGNNTYLGL